MRSWRRWSTEQAMRQRPIHQEEEQRARAALEARRELPFSDEEWAEVRKNLTTFFLVLRDWSEHAKR